MRRFFSKLSNALKLPNTARGARPGARRAQLRVEALEDRRLLTLPPGAILTPIAAEYDITAGEKDAYGTNVQVLLGAATSGETSVPGVDGAQLARMKTYQHGTIYSSATTPAAVVYGDVAVKYRSLGGPAAFGLPVSDEAGVPASPGVRVTNFDNGHSIIWSAATGSHAVYSAAIMAEYTATARERDGYGRVVQGLLGALTSDETDAPGVAGARMATFQHGTIYWSGLPKDSAQVVYGGIAAKYASLGASGTTTTAWTGGGSGAYVPIQFYTPGFGLPVSDEANVPGMPGLRVQGFWTGNIYWSDAYGARVLSTPIDTEYQATAGSTDFYGNVVRQVLGAPTQDTQGVPGVPGAFMSTFAGGSIYWSGAPADTAHAVYGSIGDKYNELKGPAGSLGLPTSEEKAIDGGREQFFQNGKILWTPQATRVVYNTQSMTFDSGYIGFPDGITVGGWLHMTVSADGSYYITGHFHDSGFFSETVEGTLTLWSPSGQVWQKGFSGSVGGTFSPRSPNYDFVLSDKDAGLANNWADFEGGHMRTLTTVGNSHPTTGTYNPYDPNGVTTHAFSPSVTGYAVTLDASALGVPTVSVDGVAYDASAPLSAKLLPGAHSLSTNGTDAVAFTVNPDGTISYDPSLEGALTGSGTTALAVNGYAVTLDPTALGVAGLALDNMPLNGTAPSRANLLPGQHTLTTNGTDVTTFTVNPDGTVAYDPALEGALTGSGTTALAVIGRSVALDASALGTASVSADGVGHAAAAPFSVNLLPGQHSLTTNGTDVTWFTVNADGTISYDPSLQGALTGSGTTSLAVIGRAVTMDATALGVPSVSVDGVAYAATAPFSVNLLPGQHSLNDGTNVISFIVNPDGTVTYDPTLEGTLTGSGTTALALQVP
jgi:hypothetical protein